MDSLMRNFPHLMPKPPPPTPKDWKVTIKGNRGWASDEVIRKENIRQCSTEYLDALCDLVGESAHFARKYFEPKITEQAYEQSEYLIYAKRIIDHVMWDLDRMRKHEADLIHDPRAVNRFKTKMRACLERAHREINFAENYGNNIKGILAQYSSAQNFTADVVSEADAEPANTSSPWMMFCKPRAPNNTALSSVADFKFEFDAGHTPKYCQVLPPQGVLIAEHWRDKINWAVEHIAPLYPDPSEINTQYASKESIVSGSHKCNVNFSEHDSAVKFGGLVQAPPGEAPDRLPELARFFAELEGKTESRGAPLSMAQVVFSSE